MPSGSPWDQAHNPSWRANCRLNVLGIPPRVVPTMVDCSRGERDQERYGDKTQDLDRFRTSDRRNTLRPVSLVDCIEYEMISRGVLPALYSLGDRVTSGLDLNLFSYMVSIYKEYDIYHIPTDPSLSSRFFCLPCSAHRLEPSTVVHDLMGWTFPVGATHVHCHGYLGYTPTVSEQT